MISRSEIMAIRSLADKRGRAEQGLFVVEGRKMVGEAVASGLGVREVFATADCAEGFPYARTVSPSEFERLSRLKSPQGVLALVEIPEQVVPSVEDNELVIALDCVQDPGNLGTILRTADWFGIRNIICSPDTVDCYNPKVVQATMGSLFRVAVHYTDLPDFLENANPARLPLYGAFLDGESIYSADLNPSGILVMGNEGNGICPAIEEYVTHRISIPSFAAGGRGAESLNVAIATSVIVSEFRSRSC